MERILLVVGDSNVLHAASDFPRYFQDDVVVCAQSGLHVCDEAAVQQLIIGAEVNRERLHCVAFYCGINDCVKIAKGLETVQQFVKSAKSILHDCEELFPRNVQYVWMIPHFVLANKDGARYTNINGIILQLTVAMSDLSCDLAPSLFDMQEAGLYLARDRFHLNKRGHVGLIMGLCYFTDHLQLHLLGKYHQERILDPVLIACAPVAAEFHQMTVQHEFSPRNPSFSVVNIGHDMILSFARCFYELDQDTGHFNRTAAGARGSRFLVMLSRLVPMLQLKIPQRTSDPTGEVENSLTEWHRKAEDSARENVLTCAVCAMSLKCINPNLDHYQSTRHMVRLTTCLYLHTLEDMIGIPTTHENLLKNLTCEYTGDCLLFEKPLFWPARPADRTSDWDLSSRVKGKVRVSVPCFGDLSSWQDAGLSANVVMARVVPFFGMQMMEFGVKCDMDTFNAESVVRVPFQVFIQSADYEEREGYQLRVASSGESEERSVLLLWQHSPQERAGAGDVGRKLKTQLRSGETVQEMLTFGLQNVGCWTQLVQVVFFIELTEGRFTQKGLKKPLPGKTGIKMATSRTFFHASVEVPLCFVRTDFQLYRFILQEKTTGQQLLEGSQQYAELNAESHRVPIGGAAEDDEGQEGYEWQGVQEEATSRERQEAAFEERVKAAFSGDSAGSVEAVVQREERRKRRLRAVSANIVSLNVAAMSKQFVSVCNGAVQAWNSTERRSSVLPFPDPIKVAVSTEEIAPSLNDQRTLATLTYEGSVPVYPTVTLKSMYLYLSQLIPLLIEAAGRLNPLPYVVQDFGDDWIYLRKSRYTAARVRNYVSREDTVILRIEKLAQGEYVDYYLENFRIRDLEASADIREADFTAAEGLSSVRSNLTTLHISPSDSCKLYEFKNFQAVQRMSSMLCNAVCARYDFFAGTEDPGKEKLLEASRQKAKIVDLRQQAENDLRTGRLSKKERKNKEYFARVVANRKIKVAEETEKTLSQYGSQLEKLLISLLYVADNAVLRYVPDDVCFAQSPDDCTCDLSSNQTLRKVNSKLEALRSDEISVLCVEGVPGSGKSYCFAHMIVKILTEDSTKQQKIIALACTNSAVENLVEQVLQLSRGRLQKSECIILSSHANYTSRYGYWMLKDIDSAEIPAVCEESQRGRSSLFDLLDGRRLVFATVDLSLQFWSRLLTSEFTAKWLFLDEASMINIVTFLSLAMRTEKVVLAGDRHQGSVTLGDRDDYTQLLYANVSALSFVSACLNAKAALKGSAYLHDNYLLLYVSYRCNPQTCQIVTNLCRLQHCMQSCRPRYSADALAFLKSKSASLAEIFGVGCTSIVHVSGQQVPVDRQSSVNLDEEIVAMRVVAELEAVRSDFEAEYHQPLTVAIIAMQARTIQFVNKFLNLRYGSVPEWITVASVPVSQGRTFTFTLLLLTESSFYDGVLCPRVKTGLLTDYRQLTVAFSRHCVGLVVIGNIYRFLQQPSLLNDIFKLLESGALAFSTTEKWASSDVSTLLCYELKMGISKCRDLPQNSRIAAIDSFFD